MPVPSKMSDLFTIAASNSPAGSDAIGNSLDDYLRATQAILRSTNALASASIASASTTDLSTADGESVQITGSATITSLGTAVPGLIRECRFAGACTITNSTAIILPLNQNITTSAGDSFTFRSLGSGNWVMVGGSRGIGSFLPLAGGTLTGPLSGTTGTFSGQVTVGTNLASSTTSLVLGTTGAGTCYLRPNGIGSSTGQALVTSSGDLQTSGTSVTSGQNFISNGASVVLATTGSGTCVMRPNGAASAVGQLTLDSGGGVVIGGGLTSGGAGTFGGAITAGTSILSNSVNWVAAPSPSGTFIFRPNGVGSTTNQSTMGTDGIWRAVDFVVTSDRSLKTKISKLSRGIDSLKKMAPVQYIKGGRDEIGFIAQDAQMVIPEAVSSGPDGKLSLSYGQVVALVAAAVLEVDERLTRAGI